MSNGILLQRMLYFQHEIERDATITLQIDLKADNCSVIRTDNPKNDFFYKQLFEEKHEK